MRGTKAIGWVVVPNSTALKRIIPASTMESDKPLVLFLVGDGTSEDDFSLAIDFDLWTQISEEYSTALDYYNTKRVYNDDGEVMDDNDY